MLLTRQHRRYTPPRLNLAAMIDVVFLVLIFFLCTSSFHIPDHHLAGELPGSKPDSVQQDLGPIRVQIGIADGGVRIECDGGLCRDFEQLYQNLAARRNIADLPVIIHGQGDVPFESMAAALNACYRAGLHKAAFSVREEAP